MKIKKSKMKKVAVSLFFLAIFLTPTIIFSQGVTPPPDVDPWGAIDTITNLVFGILLAVAVLAIIYAGFLFITAGGVSEKVTTARTTLLYAVVGIIVALLARGVVSYLHEMFQ